MLGEGSHEGPGHDHAEVVALAAAGEEARGSTVYVTLEPCVHHGRTPPCADAMIAAGVGRVIVAVVDPDDRVAGKGLARLRDAGVEVVEGLLADEGVAIDPAYFHHRRTGLPLVTLKYAMTLDGSVGARDGSSRWITSEAAREDAHRLRASADAVVVGGGTVRADDPRLDVRLEGYVGRQPRPVVVVGSERMPESAALWERDPLIIATGEIDVPAGEVMVVEGSDDRPDPRASCVALAERGYLDVLLEGGPGLAASWWHAGVVIRGVVYVGAQMGGGAGIPPIAGVFSSIGDATPARITSMRTLGPDLRIDFEQA